MRVLRYGDGTRYGNPNSRWGSPSVVLEIGDAGFVNTGLPPGTVPPASTKKKPKAMNETPVNPKVLRAQCHDLADGLTVLQDVIGMKQNRAADVRADLLKLEGDPAAAGGSAANKGSELVYNETKAAVAAGHDALQLILDGTAHKFLLAYRKILVDVHGPAWSPAWASAGFSGPKTALPDSEAGTLALLSTARAYLTAHPELELDLPAPHTSVTAAIALTLHTNVSDARALINTRKGAQQTAGDLRDADVKKLAKRFSGSVGELTQVLGPADGRWEDMGLNIPAHPTVPLSVSSLTLTPAGPGKLAAEWPHARRASRYRVFIKVAGVDVDYRFYAKTNDLDLILTGLPSGAVVHVRIDSANEAGEAAPSPSVSATVA